MTQTSTETVVSAAIAFRKRGDMLATVGNRTQALTCYASANENA